MVNRTVVSKPSVDEAINLIRAEMLRLNYEPTISSLYVALAVLGIRHIVVGGLSVDDRVFVRSFLENRFVGFDAAKVAKEMVSLLGDARLGVS